MNGYVILQSVIVSTGTTRLTKKPNPPAQAALPGACTSPFEQLLATDAGYAS